MALEKFKLNRAGVRALLRSQEMQDMLRAEAGQRCPDGCEVDVKVGRNRANARIKAVTEAAYWDDRKNKTLSEAIRQ